MTRRRVPNPLALAVLACLTERPMHPYEISTTLRTRGKEKSIKLNYGSLYSVVESLQKHGLIAARETTRDGRRPGAHGLRDHRGRLRGVRGLAGRAAVDAGPRLHLARGRALADAGAAARRGRRGCSTQRAAKLRMRAAGARRRRSAYARELGAARHSSRREPRTGGACCQAELDFVHRLAERHPLRTRSAARPSGGACTSCAPRACRSRRSSPTPSATSERRREPSHRLRPDADSEPPAGAATPARGLHPSRTASGPSRGALHTIGRCGRLPSTHEGARMSATRYGGRRGRRARQDLSGRPRRAAVRALDGLSVESPPAPSSPCSARTAPASPPPSRSSRRSPGPTPARAPVAGHRRRCADPDAVRRAIGLVSQKSVAATRWRPARENLVLAARIQGLSARRRARRAPRELLDRFGLADAADRLVKTYSGGMARKLDVAIGLVHRPRVLFLDEPTTGLDPEARAEMWAEIARLAGRRAGHRPAHHALPRRGRPPGRPAGDRRPGRVVVEGTPDELKRELRGDTVARRARRRRRRRRARALLAGARGLREVAADGRRLRARADERGPRRARRARRARGRRASPSRPSPSRGRRSTTSTCATPGAASRWRHDRRDVAAAGAARPARS